MKYLVLVFLSTLYCSLLFYSCIDNSSTDSNDEIVNVQVDLQSGFQGNVLLAKCNDKIMFNEKLSTSVPLSGPLATFTTYIPKGNNKVYFFWGLDSLSNRDSIEFIIDESDIHYLGVNLYSDTLEFRIQKTEFGYL